MWLFWSLVSRRVEAKDDRPLQGVPVTGMPGRVVHISLTGAQPPHDDQGANAVVSVTISWTDGTHQVRATRLMHATIDDEVP